MDEVSAGNCPVEWGSRSAQMSLFSHISQSDAFLNLIVCLIVWCILYRSTFSFGHSGRRVTLPLPRLPSHRTHTPGHWPDARVPAGFTCSVMAQQCCCFDNPETKAASQSTLTFVFFFHCTKHHLVMETNLGLQTIAAMPFMYHSPSQALVRYDGF